MKKTLLLILLVSYTHISNTSTTKQECSQGQSYDAVANVCCDNNLFSAASKRCCPSGYAPTSNKGGGLMLSPWSPKFLPDSDKICCPLGSQAVPVGGGKYYKFVCCAKRTEDFPCQVKKTNPPV